MLDVIQLHFDYSDKPLLQDVHFSLGSGELLHLQGPNGSGKTTLLRLIAGLLYPTQGEIHYQGSCIHQKATHYRQAMCYLGHKTGVSMLLTPREHWRLDFEHTQTKFSFEDAIATLSLQGLEDTPCALLFAGQRRRIGFLRLLVSLASLWLLDEPLVALDHSAMMVLKQLIQKHREVGGQVLLTSHQSLPFEVGTYQVYEL